MDFEVFGHIVGSFFLPLALVVLLVIAAAQDLKTKEVSGWLTLFPLLVTVAWRTATGGWVLLVTFVIIALFSERVVCQSRSPSLAVIVTGLVAVFFFLPGSPAYWTLLGWLAAWLLWEFNVTGGADVKLMMLLVTVYPDPRMLFLILLAKLVAGLVVPAALYGRRVAKHLFSAAFLVLAARQMPDRETLEREGLPAVFVYTMAGVAYVLVFAMQCPVMASRALSWDPQNGVLALQCGVEFGDPITLGILALAFVIGTVPIALFLRSVPRLAGLRSTLPCGQHWVPPSAGLRSVLAHGRKASPEQHLHWAHTCHPAPPSKLGGAHVCRGTHPAGLHSPDCTGRSTLPCTGPLGTVCHTCLGRQCQGDKCATSTGGQHWVPSKIPRPTGLPAVRQNGHAGLCRRVQPAHTTQTCEE